MQLDRTEVSIRQRPALELLDLSLLVLRRHFWPVVQASAILGIPFLVVNGLSVAWIFGESAMWATVQLDDQMTALRFRNAMHLAVLYTLEFPLVSLPCTLMLGNLLFYQELKIRDLLSRMLPIAFRCIFVLGILRVGLAGLLVEPFVDRNSSFDPFTEFFLLMCGTGLVLLVRGCVPFAPEILALELCPLRTTKPGEVTYRTRSKRLHGMLTSENFSRTILVAICSVLLFVMIMGTQIWLIGISTGDWQWGSWYDYVGIPIALWLVGMFVSVFRFLSYLDCRIRLEGWEIELRLKAEAARLATPEVITTGSQIHDVETVSP